MPSSSTLAFPRGLSLYQIQKCIPRKWKQEKPINGDKSIVDSLITSLKQSASQGDLFKAFRTFSLIQFHAASYDRLLEPISSLVLSCTNLKLLAAGKQLHGCIISLGFEQHPVLVPKLVTFYSTFNLLFDAHVVTENSNVLHPLPWNLLISSYVRNGLCKVALSTYEQMVGKGVRPDNFTYPSVLKACGEELDLGFGREVHRFIDASSLEWSLFVQNALVAMYGKCGEVGVARDVFDKMPVKDAVSWNSMISGYAFKGMWEEAFHLFESMRMEGVELNIITWNTIAGGCLRRGNFKGALKLLSQMRNCGIHLDYVGMIIGLSACSHDGAIKLGKEIHGSVIRSYCDGIDNVNNALITMYSRCKDLEHAYILFQLIEAESIIAWNCMLSGYTHMDRYEEASFLFKEMMLSGLEPNHVTIACILPLCARVANLQHGKEFHCYIMRREGFGEYLLLWNALVNMYARSGRVLEAKRVFDSLNKKDVVTYTSLIAGYGMQGEGRAALQLVEEMNRFQIKPDHVTMVAVLSACSHSGPVIQSKVEFYLKRCRESMM